MKNNDSKFNQKPLSLWLTGAMLGTSLGGVPGTVIGGAVGGIIGSFGGNWFGTSCIDYLYGQ